MIDVDTTIQDFDRMKFWREISKELTCYRPRTNEIHHPTLRFMHKWLRFSLFPRQDFALLGMMNLNFPMPLSKEQRFHQSSL